MYRVKRVEAQGLLSELKAFSFEGNEDFQNGTVQAVEVQKTFHFPPNPIFSDAGNAPRQKSILSFQASRMGEKIRSRPAYVYDLAATAERTIGFIPFTIFDELDEDDQAALEIVEEGSLGEAYTVSFSASNHEPGQIEVVHSYRMMCRGESFYDLSNMELVNTYDGVLEQVPENGTDGTTIGHYVADEILAERLPEQSERLINDLAFRAIVNPFSESPELGIASFRESVEQMRAIMDGLRNGINTRRLYDISPPGLTMKETEEMY